MKKFAKESVMGAALVGSVLTGCGAETSNEQQVVSADLNDGLTGPLRGDELATGAPERLSGEYYCAVIAGSLALKNVFGDMPDVRESGTYQQPEGDGWVDIEKTDAGYVYNFEAHPADSLVVRGNASVHTNDVDYEVMGAWDNAMYSGDITLDHGFSVWNLETGEGDTAYGDSQQVCAAAYDIWQATKD